MSDDTKTITLKDGRTLAYTEHGDSGGAPVILFHGNPGSRFMRHPDESLTASLGVRLITPDRPGYGLSDFQPNRKLIDMGDDIALLADTLDLDKFAIMGISAGGPYVVATAYTLRDRITRGAIVSGGVSSRSRMLRSARSGK